MNLLTFDRATRAAPRLLSILAVLALAVGAAAPAAADGLKIHRVEVNDAAGEMSILGDGFGTDQQKVVATAHQALGAQATAAGGLDIYMCRRQGAGPYTTDGFGGIFGLTAPANQRHIYGLSAMFTNLAAGTYSIGLCGMSLTPANWNNPEFGYVTAMVLP